MVYIYVVNISSKTGSNNNIDSNRQIWVNIILSYKSRNETKNSNNHNIGNRQRKPHSADTRNGHWDGTTLVCPQHILRYDQTPHYRKDIFNSKSSSILSGLNSIPYASRELKRVTYIDLQMEEPLKLLELSIKRSILCNQQ